MTTGASHEIERIRGKVTANMERNVSRHHTELVCLNAQPYCIDRRFRPDFFNSGLTVNIRTPPLQSEVLYPKPDLTKGATLVVWQTLDPLEFTPPPPAMRRSVPENGEKMANCIHLSHADIAKLIEVSDSKGEVSKYENPTSDEIESGSSDNDFDNDNQRMNY
ncbi:hypothetical protein TNCV_1537481 [Trichonephila clavipes]|nr:hypothetical protein TNCV_1537481 [Trichonephila clavipes]